MAAPQFLANAEPAMRQGRRLTRPIRISVPALNAGDAALAGSLYISV